MNIILGLLQEKNQLLHHFLKLTKEQCERVLLGDFSRLQLFYETREGLLGLLKKIDERVDVEQAREGLKCRTEDRVAVHDYLNRKEQIINQILDLDLQIISVVEREKSEVIRELRGVSRGKKVVGAYRSGLKASQG